jgi:hypothetical protein
VFVCILFVVLSTTVPVAPAGAVFEVPVDVSAPSELDVGSTTTVSASVTRPDSLPSFTDPTVTVTLKIDGQEIASEEVTLSSETTEVSFSPTFDSQGDHTVTVVVTGTAGGQELSGSVSRTVSVIDRVTVTGPGFTVPPSFEDEVASLRANLSSVPDDWHAFVLASNDTLYLTFTSSTPADGTATVTGIRSNLTTSQNGLNFRALVAENATFETDGRDVSLTTLGTTPGEYGGELVETSGYYRRASLLVDPDAGGGDDSEAAATAGLLSTDRVPANLTKRPGRTAGSLVNKTVDQSTAPERPGNASVAVRDALGNDTTAGIPTLTLEHARWAAANATLDGIVLQPDSKARAFVRAFAPANLTATSSGRSVLYVTNETFDPTTVADVGTLQTRSTELAGEVVTVESRVFAGHISVQETLEHATTSQCTADRLLVQTPEGPICVNVVVDERLEAGIAWNTIPTSRDQTLLFVGISSNELDQPADETTGRYRLTGKLLDTSQVDPALPNGSVLVVFDSHRVGAIDWDAVGNEARQLIRDRADTAIGRVRSDLNRSGNLVPGGIGLNASVPSQTNVSETANVSASVELPSALGPSLERSVNVTLSIDGHRIATRNVTVSDGSERSVSFTPTFNATGEHNVTVDVRATIEGVTYTRTVSRRVSVVEPVDRVTITGPSFTVPPALEDEIASFRANLSSVPDDWHAFVLASNDTLYLTFTSTDPVDGLATVTGVRPARTVSVDDLGLNFTALVAENVSFDTDGQRVPVDDLVANASTYDGKFIETTGYHRSASVLVDPDQKGTGDDAEAATTIGILTADRASVNLTRRPGRTAASLALNASLDGTTVDPQRVTDKTENVSAAVARTLAAENHDRTGVTTIAFEAGYWTAANASVHGVVVEPGSPASEYMRAAGVGNVSSIPGTTSTTTFYVTDQTFDPTAVADVAEVHNRSGELLGETVSLETRLHSERMSVQETLEHATNESCTVDRVPVETSEGTACVNLVVDVRVEGGVAWNDVRVSSDAVLPVVGLSSFELDSPTNTTTGRYQLVGTVVETNQGIPAGSSTDGGSGNGTVLVVHTATRLGGVDWSAVENETRQLVENRTDRRIEAIRSGISSIRNQTPLRETNEPPSAALTATPSSIDEGQSVTLDASGSTDPDNNLLSYSWSVVNQPPNASAATPKDASGSVVLSTPGSYRFQVVVSDGNASDTATVNVSVTDVNVPPTADLVAHPSTIPEGESTTLNATGSTDPDDGSLSYSWSVVDQPSGASVVSPTGASGSVDLSTPGSYRFQVVVSDGNASDTATVNVSVTDVNVPPTADAGLDRTVRGGTTLDLDATRSNDSDGDSLSYNWTQVAGQSVNLSDSDTATPTLTAPSVSSEVVLGFEVAVRDGRGGVDSDTVNVSVEPAPTPNEPPVATFSYAPSSPAVNETVQFDARNSTDPDGSVASYNWAFDGAGEPVETRDPTGVTARRYLSTGSYDVTLTVTDDDGRTNVTTRTVQVESMNRAPIADAGANQTVRAGEDVVLTATGSTDPDGDALNYQWTQTAGKSVMLSGTDSATPTFTAPPVSNETRLLFEVRVSDGAGSVDTDTVRITVQPDEPSTQLSIRLGDGGNVSAEPDSRIEIPIIVDRAPDGLTRVENVNVSVSNASTAIVNTNQPLNNSSSEFEASLVELNDVGPSFVNYSANALSNATAPGPGSDILVGTVVLTTRENGGTTTVDLDVGEAYSQSSLSNDSTAKQNSTIEFRTIDTSLTVPTNPFPGRTSPPTDVRPSQPGYEDFDGDGRFSFLDVVEVLFAIGDVPAEDAAKVDAVDYDDDGSFTFLDVVELLFRL